MKKNSFIAYVMSALCIFTVSLNAVSANEYTNYFGINMTNQEYNNLLNLGFSEDEIYYMSEETFEENKNFESELVSQTEKYYKTIYTDLNGNSYSTEVSKDEYDNQSTINTKTTVETEYKKMVTTISKNSNNTFRYKVNLLWKLIPSTRSYDIIGIGFNDNVYISSLVNFNYYYCNSSAECTNSGLYYDKKELSTGGSAVYKVPSGSLTSLSSTLYYDVSKNTTSTISYLSMYGDYAHATASVPNGNYVNHSINTGGIQFFNGLSGYYDAIPCADSHWSGTW